MRTQIPRSTRRLLLVEAGYKCSVTHCPAESSLEFHHIDGNPSNNADPNILVVCSNHHHQCTLGKIDKKACRTLKRMLKEKGNLITPASLRRIIREALKPSKKKGGRHHRISDRSILDRQYLLHVIRDSKYTYFPELFAALRVIESSSFRIEAGIFIEMLNRIRIHQQVTKNQYLNIYHLCIRLLSNIGTASALNWLASEYEKADDVATQFFLFVAISNSVRARKHVGFKIGSSVASKQRSKNVNTITFSLRGKVYVFEIREL